MYSSHSHSFFGIHFNKRKYIIYFVISCYVWPCYFLIAHCQLITLLTFSVCLFCIYFTYSESIPCMFHYGFLLHLTLGCRHSKQIFPELIIRLTESVFVPYKFCSNSPDSRNFPAARSDSKLCRETKLYSLPLTSCARGVRVVSVTRSEIHLSTIQSSKLCINKCWFVCFNCTCKPVFLKGIVRPEMRIC